MDGLRRAIPALILAALIVASCSAQVRVPEEGGSLTIACSDSFLPLAQALADEFTAREPHIAVQLDIGNSRNVLERLETGKADVSLLAEPPESLPTGWQQRPIALEGLAIIVHSERLLSEAGVAQIQAMFNGRLAAWEAAGEEGGEIQPVSRENGSSARSLFESTVMGDKRVTLRAVVMPSSALVVEYVAAHPDAIGYVAAHWADATVKALAVEGILPTPENVRVGEYPLVMVGYLVWRTAPTVEARAFAEFASSPMGRAVVVNAGYAAP